MRLAWRNLAYEWRSFGAAATGVATAVFLIVFQAALLIGFLESSSAVIDASDGELWVVPKGAVCLEVSGTMEERMKYLVMGDPGVVSARRMLVRPVVWRKPSGIQQLVLLVGVDGDRRSEMVAVDASNARLLEVSSDPTGVELNRRRAWVVETVYGFGSFLGSPYVFSSYEEAERYVEHPSLETSFVLLRIADGESPYLVRDRLRLRFPEVDVWMKSEFSWSARRFWVMQTGAGIAILIGAVLAVVLGLVLISQIMYSAIVNRVEEFATLKAIGASRGYVARVVVLQALATGLAGSVAGALVAVPGIALAREWIPWVHAPFWLPLVVLVLGPTLCIVAGLLSVRRAVTIEPARVFRV